MKIAICDDELEAIDLLKCFISSHSCEHEVFEFTSSAPLLKRIANKEPFDLLFLDVQMPDSSGWEIAKRLKQSKEKIYIAMITVLGDYIHECFDRVDWFATKPVTSDKIHTILNRANEKLFPPIMQVKSDKILLTLTPPEIWYIEVKRNHVYINTFTQQYKTRLSLSDIKHLIKDMPCFAQTHQSYIINLEYYDRIEGNDIILKNNVRVPLSRHTRKDYFISLSEYLRRC